MNKRVVLLSAGLAFCAFQGAFCVEKAEAAAPITFRYEHHLFTLDPDAYPQWSGHKEEWLYNGQPIEPLAAWRTDGDEIPALPEGVTRTAGTGWDASAIQGTILSKISSAFDRSPGGVTISRDAEGKISFQGVGLTGRQVDTASAALAAVSALEQGFTDVILPVKITQPAITVTDPGLQAMGIKEVVTVGESVFAGSPVNRRHNISVGLSKFNGHLIPQGTVFSFDTVLGPVDGSTGYRKELVIKGDRTEPDYGGGLCQVSSTAYRGVWEYGFPITERRNHSYAVSYYGPVGTDATVYPPHPDMAFTNDSPGALLIQTHQENDHAYFIYYGTRDTRKTEVWGPVIFGNTRPPPDKIVETTELPPGVRRKVGDRHAGLTAVWYRTLKPVTGDGKTEKTVSIYEARPLFIEVGVDAISLPETTIDLPEAPQTF